MKYVYWSYTIDIMLSILYFQWPKVIQFDGLTQNAFYISLPYLFWVENLNFGISTHLLTQMNGFSGSILSMQSAINIDAGYKQRIEIG